MRGISWLAVKMSASKEWIFSTVWVTSLSIYIFIHLIFPLAVQLFSVTRGTFSSQVRHQSRCLCRQVRTFGTAPPDAANRPKIPNIKSAFLYTGICCELSDRQHIAPPPPAVKSPTFMCIPLRPPACRTASATGECRNGRDRKGSDRGGCFGLAG